MANPRLEPLCSLTPIERLIMLFSEVVKAGNGINTDTQSHLVGYYLQESVLLGQIDAYEVTHDVKVALSNRGKTL